ncbi:tyrosine-protein phosphatase [Streptomyces aidingensis]|uniref:Protein-tyrosine phosphatase n=1 Tax=Streptomyces aidingensis TaxID=910347 RepID=A0A1I1JJ35_9ACTN|nr:tyrosine-protein phosphatase [Streptomyces aidingensis]SFC46618.1 protein-tyrosine phosphatase [Streptomyces aidingensis]
MTQQQSAEPLLTNVRNFRDLGGLPTTDGHRIRTGRLFRSGHLAHATEEDQRFLSELRLHTIFDFRNSADRAVDGLDVELPGVRNVNLPLSDPADGAEFWRMVRHGDLSQLRESLGDGRAAARMTASYRMLISARTAEYGQVLRTLADGAMPALLHCAAGKDRAGLTVAVVLLAVGVERDAIVTDYLLSGDAQRRYRFRRAASERTEDAAATAEITELLAPLFDARAEYLQAAFDEIEQEWSGTENYLSRGLGLTAPDRERLRASLLGASA